MSFYFAAGLEGFVDGAFASNDKNAFARGRINIAFDSDLAGKDIFGPLIAI